jgi:hypothetical protein
MTSTRPTFRQIPAPLDVDDGALDRINDKLGVPSLVKPASEMPSGDQGKPQDSPRHAARPSPSSESPRAKKSTIPAPVPSLGPVEKLSIELPGYLTDAMRRQAAEQRTSVRHIVMRGLAALGFEIASGDLVPDGRRLRGKSKKR